MNITPSPRAGDADRDKTIEHLSSRHVSGHLNAAEFSARLDGAFAAETQAQLSGLVADLPPLPQTGRPAMSGKARRTTFWLAMAVLNIAVASVPIAIVASVSHGAGHAQPVALGLAILSFFLGVGGLILSLEMALKAN